MTDDVYITWHSYAVRNNLKIALCEAMGDPTPRTYIGLWITSSKSHVNCQNCLEWMHA